MSYIEDITRIQNVSVEDAIEVSKRNVPNIYRFRPWTHPELNHGVNLLESEDALCCYMAAYGEMHELKCKAVLRNLPFESFSNFEVFDWGCGQGIGTICLTEMLQERNKLHLLQKVTLVEPSRAALDRATFNVNLFTRGVTRVIPIEKFLPSVDNNEHAIDGITYEYSTIIHIFSNILDVNNIDIAALSRMIPQIGTQQYIVCIGPKNSNSNRIELFSSIFAPEQYLSNINAPIFGTTTTNHQFGCKALSWEYNNSPLSLDAINNLPHNITANVLLDDYATQLAVENGILHPQAAQLIEKISLFLGNDDIIYYKPNIDGNVADIVIVRPHAGIYIIQVFDYDITKETKKSPIGVLKKMKEELITLHIKQSAENYISQRGYWSILNMIGFFTQNTAEEVEQYCSENQISHDHETILGKDSLQIDLREIFTQIGFFQSRRIFTSIVKKDFLKLISPGWHSYKEGAPIPLTRKQQDLSLSHIGKQKIKGIAGSGKTEVMVHRAVNAQIRTGEKVLLLTYNLSLRNYIHLRLSRVRADFAWDQFYITNYHQLIKNELLKHDIDTFDVSFDDEQLFNGYENEIQKYSAIFIDEIQDYKPVWLSIINKYFLADAGELVVFGDPSQKMYDNCELDKQGDIRIGVIPGEWNGQLIKGIRYTNAQLAHFTNLFGHKYLGDELLQQAAQQQIGFDTRIVFKQLQDEPIEHVVSCIEHELEKIGIDIQTCPDLAILSDTHNIVRLIEKALKEKYIDLPIITTSESQTQYDNLLARYEGDYRNPLFERDKHKIRRMKKVHFAIDTEAVKISTIKSYKGLEAETAIVIVEPNCEPSVLYTGLTRAKNNLVIISLGNPQYDSFFQANIK